MDTTKGVGLSRASHIGVIGDVHGDMVILRRVLESMAARRVTVLLQVGDLGLLWPGHNPERSVAHLCRLLNDHGQVLFWVDGNHESFSQLNTAPVTSDGLRTLAPNIHHMTRGYRTRLVTGRTLAALGGANSIDRHLRSKTTWWREESITDNDLDRLGTGPVDILIGHDAPRFVPTLDSHPERTEHEWPMNAVMYANEGRQTFHTGFMQVRPKLYLGGHYHLPVDETVGYWTGDIGFATRLVLLDQISAPASASAAILDVEQFTLQFYTSDGVEVPVMPQNTELTTRSMGAWMVWTLTAKYLFDMDHGTVECVSGGAEAPFWAGEHQRLRKLEACRVGEPARWTMHPKYRDGDDTWHVSSIVRFIEPAPEA